MTVVTRVKTSYETSVCKDLFGCHGEQIRRDHGGFRETGRRLDDDQMGEAGSQSVQGGWTLEGKRGAR